MVTGHYPALDQLVDQVAQLRPLPSSAVRILELTQEERFSAHDLATAIAHDQALTAKLLRLANSAYYSFPRRISTARDAVVLLGFREVRSTALVSCMIDSAPGSTCLNYEQFWQFSLSVGMLAEILGRTEGQHRDHAFTAGVLHNIGRLALDQHLPAALQQSVEHARREQVSIAAAERTVLGYTDAELGAALADGWRFPPALVEAIDHHAGPISALPDPRSVAALVVRARAFAISSGLPDGTDVQAAVEPTDEWTAPPLSAALQQAGGLARVVERARVFVQSTT